MADNAGCVRGGFLNPHRSSSDLVNIPEGTKVVLDTRSRVRSPRLSLIVPAFRVEACIEDCLRSILNAASERRPIELIVIDDGSDDDTLERAAGLLGEVSGHAILLLTQDNRGLSAVRNLGASLACGEWIAFLDSDDELLAAGFYKVWAAAERTSADLILAGALLFDESRRFRPFYHQTLWRQLLGGNPHRLTSVHETPRLMGLEPNVNYRWIRRSFYHSRPLVFPEGLYFEDAPVHFRMMRLSASILLIDEAYYLYRVGRPGKITETRSHRQFDAIRTLMLSVDDLKSTEVGLDEAASALRILDRIAWGCARMTFPADRKAYFHQLLKLQVAIPWVWRLRYLQSCPRDPRHFLLGVLLFLGFPELWMGIGLLMDLKRRIRLELDSLIGGGRPP